MNPTIKDLRLVRGDTAYLWITISGATPEEVSFSIKRRYSDTQYVAHKSLTDGITLDDGKYVVRLAPEDTANLPATRYCYDVELIINGDVITPILGTFDLTPDVTHSNFTSAEREYSYTAATTDNVLLDISVDITQEPPEGVSFTVLKGDKGDPGHSPEVTASKTDGTTTISVDGEPIAEIIDGVDGHSPVVTASKTDGITTVYVDGNPIASISDGIDGHSPVVTASKSGGVTTIYVDGTAIAIINDGEDGHTPEITASKSGGTVTISVDGVVVASISDGTDGEDGTSPTATVTKAGNTATITITDKNGTTSETISDGEDGYTPVKGTDYWTDNDKTEIVEDVTEELADDLDGKADVIIRNASGDMVDIYDGADNAPVERLVVSIEPVQDLHGYENPWPAGGGKNLFKNTAVTQTISGITFTVNSDGTVIATGTADGNSILNLGTITLPSGNYIANGMIGGASGQTLIRIYSGSTTTKYVYDGDTAFSLSEDTEITVAIYVYSGFSVSNKTYYPMIRLASITDDSFAPYSNICPVSGRTGVKVTRTGKNLADISPENIYHESQCTRVFENGGLVITPTGNYGNVGITLNVKTGKQYTISMKAKATGNIVRIALSSDTNWHYKDYGVIVAGGRIASTLTDYRKTITALSDKVYLECYAGSSTLTIEDIQLELGSTATEYEPYAGDVYDISFGEAGTVYGAKLDAITGELVVDRANIPSYNGESLPSTWISDRDVYAEGATPTTGAQVVYKLAEPLTYNLSPQEITTLLGENHIWADSGAVDVDYHADTKTYIDNEVDGANDYTDDAKAEARAYTDTAVAAITSKTVTVSGTSPTITAQANTRYICGEVLSLSFTPCASGICDIRFTSGSSATILTLPNTVKMPEWFDGTCEPNTVYEINILDGIYGAVMAWEA